MYSTVTRDIVITVLPEFVPERSDASEASFWWAYTVEIANRGDMTVQLTARHWKITDGNGRLEEVQGAGVVGEQPILQARRDLSLYFGHQYDDAIRHHDRDLSHGEREGRCFRRGNSRLLSRFSPCAAGSQLSRGGF